MFETTNYFEAGSSEGTRAFYDDERRQDESLPKAGSAKWNEGSRVKRANSSGKDERSEFLAGEEQNKGSYQSGQMGQTVNLLAYAFGGSNPSLPTKKCRLELQDFQWCPPAGIAEGEG